MDATNTAAPTPTPRVTTRALFMEFLKVGMSGFGGVLPFARRMLVEQRRWLDATEFTEVLSLSQFLPGPNIVNVSVIVGRRFRGPIGSVAATLGLLLMPMAFVLLLAMVFAEFAQVDAVRGACTGVSAAASGLVLALALRMGKTIRSTPWQIGVAIVAFVAIGVARQPLLWVLAALVPRVAGLELVEARVIPPVLFELALQFLVLSLLSIGGANAIIPEIHLRAVDVHHWMTDVDFSQMFALAQAAPGPNVLIVSLVGWKAAGIAGALVAMAAMCGPSSALTYFVANVWERFREAPLRIAIQRALEPVTVGLVLSSGYVLTRMTDHAWPPTRSPASTLLLALTTRLHPLWMLAAAAGLARGWVWVGLRGSGQSIRTDKLT